MLGGTFAQAASEPLTIKIKPQPTGVKTIVLDAYPLSYRVTMRDGQTQSYNPQAFAEFLLQDQQQRGWWYALLNISNPFGLVWVTVGLLGQVLFTGRMIVQGLASEKHKRSVVPVAFWWMSLIGATMLITYFLWRQDIIGVLGQATGWGIYIRNLMLIYRHHPPSKTAAPEDIPESIESTP